MSRHNTFGRSPWIAGALLAIAGVALAATPALATDGLAEEARVRSTVEHVTADGWTTPRHFDRARRAAPTSIARPAAPARLTRVTTRTWPTAMPTPDTLVVRTRAQADDIPPPPPPPSLDAGGTWSTPAPTPLSPAPPAPPGGVTAPTVSTAPAPVAPCPPPAAAPAARCWSGCRLPCEDQISMWHVRAVGGAAFYDDEDLEEPHIYAGADIGRTFCGCWGLDLFYRTHCTSFNLVPPRTVPGSGANLLNEDTFWFHHVGLKFTWERSFGNNSRFYYWLGAGPEYWWTAEVAEGNDDGFGVYGELGLGYVISENIRVRVGLNVHGMDTDVGRSAAANVGTSRWLWVFAPVGQLEIDF